MQIQMGEILSRSYPERREGAKTQLERDGPTPSKRAKRAHTPIPDSGPQDTNALC